ncbi:putative uncharacterized protein [Firmicutes bacterium CAG:238]|nr:putative uncharacterized protein [Firmicutes bacterium CAG:238]
MNFSNNLRYLRKQRGISQDALADKLGYKSFTTIQKWESGVSEPSVSTLKIIANIFGVSMDQMINEDLSDLSQPSSSMQLTEQEERLLGICRSLNDEGCERLVEYGDDLVASGKYIKRTSEYRPVSPIPEKQKAVEDVYKKVLKNVNAKEVEYDDI